MVLASIVPLIDPVSVTDISDTNIFPLTRPATSIAPDGYTQEQADKDAKVEVTKTDMRKKENKLSPEDKDAHAAIMDSILGTEV